MTEELPDEIKRWTANRRMALALSIMRGETTVQEAPQQHDLAVRHIERWQQAFLDTGENALRSRPRDGEGVKDKRIRKLERKLGEMVLDMNIMREAVKPVPFDDSSS